MKTLKYYDDPTKQKLCFQKNKTECIRQEFEFKIKKYDELTQYYNWNEISVIHFSFAAIYEMVEGAINKALWVGLWFSYLLDAAFVVG